MHCGIMSSYEGWSLKHIRNYFKRSYKDIATIKRYHKSSFKLITINDYYKDICAEQTTRRVKDYLYYIITLCTE